VFFFFIPLLFFRAKLKANKNNNPSYTSKANRLNHKHPVKKERRENREKKIAAASEIDSAYAL